jgi:hypothetical protein
MGFSANRNDLLEYAKQSEVEKEVLQEIERMPDKEDSNMTDVMKSLGNSK